MITTCMLLLPLWSGAVALPESIGPAPVPVVQEEGTDPAAPAIRMHLEETTVGMRVRMRDVILPGPKLRAKAVLDPGKADAVLRVLSAKPHGTAYRYDLEVMPFVPGVLDLHALLERENGAPLGDLPSMTVRVAEVLAPGRLLPNDVEPGDPGRFGGYYNLMIFAGILWAIGLFFLLYLGVRKTRLEAAAAAQGGPTLAQRLQPLVESAQQGRLSDEERAGLERLLFAFWREKKGLQGQRIAQAMETLREDEDAGPLLRQLERWLHSPDRAEQNVDVRALLRPYEDVADAEAAALAEAAKHPSPPALGSA